MCVLQWDGTSGLAGHAAGDFHASSRFVGVDAAEFLSVLGDPCEEAAIANAGFDFHFDETTGQSFCDHGGKSIESLPFGGTDSDGILVAAPQHIHERLVFDTVDLIEHEQDVFHFDADFLEHFIHGSNLAFGFEIAGVDDMQQQVGMSGFFKC